MTKRANREGTFYVRTNGLWCYEIALGKGKDGKRIRRTLYARSRKELQQRVQDEKARTGGSIRERQVGTFASWVESWLETVQENRYPATYASYSGVWKKVEPLLGGSIILTDLSVDHVLLLMSRLKAQNETASAINRCLRVMHRSVEVATMQKRFYGANPFAMVERPREPESDVRSLSRDEAQRFLAVLKDDRLEALWLIAIFCGLRIGEFQSLRWSDVDMKARTIAVRKAYSVAGKSEKTPKTKASRRTVSFGSIVHAALERRREAHAKEGHESELVFCTRVGTVLSQTNVRRRDFHPLLERAGIVNLRIHDLRHSAVTFGLLAGVSPKVVSGRVGHANTKVTMDRYAHILAGQDSDAADAIEKAMT